MIAVMEDLDMSMLETLDVEGLGALPKGFRYELHEGNLVIMTPSSFWHKEMGDRLWLMLRTAGQKVFHDPSVRGDLPRDSRLPDIGVVVTTLPPDKADYSSLPGSAFGLVVEVVSEKSPNGEYTEKAHWYAARGIPEYWIVDRTADRSHEDGMVHLHRLSLAGPAPAYVRERSLLLSELEAEYRAKSA
ncbi:Uma2 family endonuclease [Symbioplanes lichenis]|uniref:Uma2 family endonuclease n=1 Tax=Symbioplanes lichenis TaxID=1629072 RepID=UPI002738C411|nr:Uma2 family endonuclease [Actinoplanes lichenis]